MPELENVLTDVRHARPYLIDTWETVAVVESLGYTDDRAKREFGVRDTRTLGGLVFDELSRRQTPAAGVAEPSRRPAAMPTLSDCVAASFVFAVPWVLVVAGGNGVLSFALMASLIVTSGFIPAIHRRGRFHLEEQHPGLAVLVSGHFFRVGMGAAAATAAMTVAVGWSFGLFAWPALVLWADQFLLLCALWLTCAIVTIRREQWRVAAAFACGASVFLGMGWLGRDVMTAQLVAVGAILATAAVQVPRIFAEPDGYERPSIVPSPHMNVLWFRLLPIIATGALSFCFLFAERLLRPEHGIGTDLAVAAFLLAAAGVEYAGLRFTRDVASNMEKLAGTALDRFQRVLRRSHLRSLVIVVAGFLVSSAIVAASAIWWLSSLPPTVWTTFLTNAFAYLLLALGLMNGLALFALNRGWAPVKALTAGLIVNVAGAPVTGGAVVLILSTVAVRRALSRAGHSVAAL